MFATLPLLPALLGVLLGAAPAAAGAPPQRGAPPLVLPGQDDEDVETRSFSLPDTRASRALAQRAEEHRAAGRWNEAAADLQRLIDDHARDLLGPSRPAPRGRPSQQDVHAGAALWAERQLFELPPEGRLAYRERFGAAAERALAEALGAGERSSLAQVAARWPITAAAERAWWALGDLELEAGNLDQARLAWGRALGLRLERRDLQLTEPADWAAARAAAVPAEAGDLAGLGLRLELAAASLDPEHELARPELERRPPGGQMRLAGPGEGAAAAPFAETDGWQAALPAHPFGGGFRSNFRLHAVRAGWRVFVSTSLELLAFDALTGEVLWGSGQVPGWERLGKEREEYFRGIAQRRTLIAPAVGSGVVVAPLQIPISQLEHRDFNTISILRRIPDRRLFAYDEATGRPLWNHLPPPNWDGESGTFAQRTMVAGPPVIVGSRVLVPAYRLDGRVDYHVACYALESGELLWSTPVISGQRELNMFSRHEYEFAAPPLRVEGDRVIALTQLGALASLDLFSGRILWGTLYDQVPLPRRRGHNATERPTTWENAPPVVAGGVVVATPSDSHDLVGLDLESGAMLWSLSQSSVNQLARGRISRIDLLLGADERTIFLSGGHVLALEAPDGLLHSRPVRTAWIYDDFDNDAPQGWPVLTRERVFVATPTQRHEIHRHSGARARVPLPWRGGRSGNLLVGGGMLFTLDGHYLNGYFDWNGLLASSAAARRGAGVEPGAALDHARLLAMRGESLRREGRSDQARTFLDEARGVLLPLIEVEAVERPARAGLHGVLRAQARIHADLADVLGAVRALREARALAPDALSLRDTLLEEISMLTGVDDDACLAALERLESSCAGLDVPVRPAQPGAGGLGALVPGEAGAGEAWRLPVGLYVTLARARLHAARGNAAAELEALHGLVREWPATPLPGGRVGALAAERIGQLLASGERAAHAPFERRAAELLERAAQGGDLVALERVAQLYPHSEASRQAHDRILELAVEVGDLARTAAVLAAELPEPWIPSRPSAREARLLLGLAAAAERVGNPALARGVLATLALSGADRASDQAQHGGRTVGELLARLPDPLARPSSPAPDLSSHPREVAQFLGRFQRIGEVPPASDAQDAQRVLLFGRSDARTRTFERGIALVAFGATNPGDPLWSVPLPQTVGPVAWEEWVGLGAGLVVVSTEQGLLALERETGRVAWSWSSGGLTPMGVRVSDGVAAAVCRGAGDRLVIFGFELTSGVPLWTIETQAKEHSEQPICGEGRLVLLPQPYAASTMTVYCLFSGRTVQRVSLRHPPQRLLARAAWIENGRVILPWFLIEVGDARNHVVAYDLDLGTLAWEVHFDRSLGGGRQLHGVFQSGPHTVLVLKPPAGAPGRGVLAELDARIGGLARLGNVELGDDHLPLGLNLGDRRRLRLDEPLLFLRGAGSRGGGLRLEAVHLPFGVERWRYEPPFDDLYTGSLPLPAVGRDVVALVVAERASRRPVSHQANLILLGRHDGGRRETQILDPRLGRSDDLELVPLGDALFVAGQQLMKVMR